MIKAYLVTFAAGAFAGFGVAWHVQAGHVDAANERTQTAINNLSQCRGAIDMQNAAIMEMEGRARKAEIELFTAKQDREKAESRADRILQERTPAGKNACEAAQEAFDAELKRERAK